MAARWDHPRPRSSPGLACVEKRGSFGALTVGPDARSTCGKEKRKEAFRRFYYGAVLQRQTKKKNTLLCVSGVLEKNCVTAAASFTKSSWCKSGEPGLAVTHPLRDENASVGILSWFPRVVYSHPDLCWSFQWLHRILSGTTSWCMCNVWLVLNLEKNHGYSSISFFFFQKNNQCFIHCVCIVPWQKRHGMMAIKVKQISFFL